MPAVDIGSAYEGQSNADCGLNSSELGTSGYKNVAVTIYQSATSVKDAGDSLGNAMQSPSHPATFCSGSSYSGTDQIALCSQSSSLPCMMLASSRREGVLVNGKCRYQRFPCDRHT